MAIGKYPSVVIDCPDPGLLANFYGQLICFQQVADYQAPTWPTQEQPQQFHLDIMVDELDGAEAAVLEMGATKAGHQPGTTFRVFLDPAGHPFCLCIS